MQRVPDDVVYRERMAGASFAEIARDHGIAASSARRQFALYRLKLQAAAQGTLDTPKLTDEARALYETYLGTSLRLPASTPARKEAQRRKIVALGDFHGNPDPALLHAVIAEAPDEIVIGGDVFNHGQASPHPRGAKAKQTLTLKQENANMRACLEMLLVHLPGVGLKIMRGNHDDWIANHFHRLVPPELLDYFTDPLDLLVAGLPRTELVRQSWTWHYPDGDTGDFGESHYMYCVGDALLSHANFTGKYPGFAVRKLALEWLPRWRRVLGLPELSLIVQFHVHKVSFSEEEGGWQVWIEPGMAGLPSTEDYKAQYKPMWYPGGLGAVVFEQDFTGEAWKTQLGGVRLIRPRRDSQVLEDTHGAS